MDEELIGEMIDGKNIAQREESLIIGGMEINGIEHSFSFREFMDALALLPEEEKSHIVVNPVGAQACMLAIMWGRRHPFEIADDDA